MKLLLLLFWILALTCTTRAQEAWRESTVIGSPTGVMTATGNTPMNLTSHRLQSLVCISL